MRRVLLALLVAVAVTTVTTSVSLASPSPVWTSSAPFGATDNGGFILYNNEWNPTAGPQTIWVYSYHHWGVQSEQAAGNVAVETYPCVQKDYNNPRVLSFREIRNGFTESMPANTTGLDAEAADVVWLDGLKFEVMIWVDNHGQRPAGKIIGYATIFGQHFALWYGGNDYTFALNHNETSGVTNILASIQWLIRHGYLSPNVTLTQVNFGWEIASTNGKPEDFKVTNYWLRTEQ
jgi:Glycosyl hydrolase family 12